MKWEDSFRPRRSIYSTLPQSGTHTATGMSLLCVCVCVCVGGGWGRGQLFSWFVGALSPVNHKELHEGYKQTSICLQVIYSTSHYSLFLKPQLKVYPQFWNTNPEEEKKPKPNQHSNTCFAAYVLFCGHSTRQPASSRVTYFILRAYTGTGVSHI